MISYTNSHQWPMYIPRRAYLRAGRREKMLRDAHTMSIITIEPQPGRGLSCRYADRRQLTVAGIQGRNVHELLDADVYVLS